MASPLETKTHGKKKPPKEIVVVKNTYGNT